MDLVAETLGDAYLEARTEHEASPAEVDACLAALLDAAEAELPTLALDRADVVRALSALEASCFELGPDEVLEVRLALGCAAGDDVAVRAFEASYMAIVDRAVAHMGLSADAMDELRQVVRDKLLVAASGPPKIVGYAGRGKLAGLVKVVAVRAAISMLRKEKRHLPGAGGDLRDLPGAAIDPELSFLKAHYRAAFKRAFEAAVRSLGSRERNVLRLHLLGGMTLEQVARMYGMHRATVIRSLAKVRKHLYGETHRRMRRELEVGQDELESIMHLVRSRLDVSLGGLLRSTRDFGSARELDDHGGAPR